MSAAYAMTSAGLTLRMNAIAKAAQPAERADHPGWAEVLVRKGDPGRRAAVTMTSSTMAVRLTTESMVIRSSTIVSGEVYCHPDGSVGGGAGWP